MNTILILVIIVLIAMTVITLVRGIAAFLQSTREDLKQSEGSGPTAMQLKQNKLMFRRIMFQGATILVVALLLSMAQK